MRPDASEESDGDDAAVTKFGLRPDAQADQAPLEPKEEAQPVVEEQPPAEP